MSAYQQMMWHKSWVYMWRRIGDNVSIDAAIRKAWDTQK